MTNDGYVGGLPERYIPPEPRFQEQPRARRWPVWLVVLAICAAPFPRHAAHIIDFHEVLGPAGVAVDGNDVVALCRQLFGQGAADFAKAHNRNLHTLPLRAGPQAAPALFLCFFFASTPL